MIVAIAASLWSTVPVSTSNTCRSFCEIAGILICSFLLLFAVAFSLVPPGSGLLVYSEPSIMTFSEVLLSASSYDTIGCNLVPPLLRLWGCTVHCIILRIGGQPMFVRWLFSPFTFLHAFPQLQQTIVESLVCLTVLCFGLSHSRMAILCVVIQCLAGRSFILPHSHNYYIVRFIFLFYVCIKGDR